MVSNNKSGIGLLIAVFGIIILIFGVIFTFYEKVVTQIVVIDTVVSTSWGYPYRPFGIILILAGIILLIIGIYLWARLNFNPKPKAFR